MYLQNLEVMDIIIDERLEFKEDSYILANDEEITDVEISYLDGVTGNIQNQINGLDTRITDNENDIISLDTRVTDNENDIIALEDKTTKISYNAGTDTTTANSNFTITGELNVTSELTLKNDPGAAGYTFLLNNNGKILYFRVKDMSGNIRTSQIQQYLCI